MRAWFSPQSRDDLSAIFAYLHARSPPGAHNVMRAIFASIQFIADHPFAARRTTDPDVRVAIVRRYGFKIFYQINERNDVIEIMHVRHGARRPWVRE